MPPTSLTSPRFPEETFFDRRSIRSQNFVDSDEPKSGLRIPLDYRLSHHRLDTAQRAPPFVVLMEEKIIRAIVTVAFHSSLSSLSSSRRSALLAAGSISHVDRIAIELFDTEKTYVEDLYAVIQGYLNFLVDHRDELGVTLDNISSLFGCIERIYAFNRKLLQQLDLADLDCVKMSRCFVDSAGKFEDYIVYCTNYHRMIATLAQLQQQPHLAAALSQRQAALGHALPLSAYLLKPVQRVLKYHLFIEISREKTHNRLKTSNLATRVWPPAGIETNMLKHLPSSLPPEDLAVVKRAHEVMTSQASRINDEKKRAEHAERVEQLQAAIQKWTVDKQNANLSAYGELLLEAQFRQAGSKTTRLLFLFEEMLLIVKQRNSSYICKDYIMSSNLMLNESIYPEEPLAFQASSADQKRTWMIELKRMMLDHYGIEIPEKTKQLMLSMDNTQRVAFGRPEFAEVSMKNHKRVPKYLEKRRKSVDKGATDNNRRRSLSASRLLGASKTSLVSDSSRYKLFGVPDVVPKCTCHMSSTPGPSGESAPARVSAISKVPVSRTLSASTIFFNGSVEGMQGAAAPDAVQSSRSRYHMARNKRMLPPRCETSKYFTTLGRWSLQTRSPSSRRIECEEIDETFNELFKELVSCGNTSPKAQVGHIADTRAIVFRFSRNQRQPLQARKAVAVPPNSSEQDSLQEVLAWRDQAVYKNRSKSLTRLDEFCDPSFNMLLSDVVQESVAPTELNQQDRRFNRMDQQKRVRMKKYYMSGDSSEMLRGGSGRTNLCERSATIAEVDSPRSDFPLIDDELISPRKLAARQRTPLTVEQAAELDALIPVDGGVVKTMIRQIESTGP
ncbi:RhoGEF domain protein [Ancylostoma duodenale]|uniref:RhoGEF domain protein n=1 Tax=Ancylostoma duodenale TaxID=51022 RepID=A0A0C2DAZ0_9BILA|nr:RhoGEF domain protein [Ancylostoma duodenale]